ncbi:hypothetical protein AgCh_038392 [Apium graveolens]
MEEEKKYLNSELWHACSGPLVLMPAAGSRVVYFPQGHSEQIHGDDEWSFEYCEEGTGECPSAKNPLYMYRDCIILGKTKCSILRRLGVPKPPGWVNRFANAGDIAVEIAGNTTFRSTSSNNDCPISHASQLSNPFLGLSLEFGKSESCGTAEVGECEGYFGYI